MAELRISRVKPRVLFLLERYPQLSETYIKAEIEALLPHWDVQIISRKRVDHPDPERRPFLLVPERRDLLAAVRDLKPQVLHTHYLHMAPTALELALETGVPFTVRSHSYDSMLVPGRPAPAGYARIGAVVAHPLCLGLLSFPYTRPWLQAAGVPAAKLHDAFPVVDVARFHDRGANGRGVMNTGAALPKKGFDDFLRLAALRPDTPFDLYPVGYQTEELAARNEALGRPVTLHPTRPSARMPEVYKAHEWLVYTADFGIGTVGWPMAVAEAQAAGCGVLLAGLRPDMEHYLGGAGYLYHSLEEAADLLARPYPEEMRERGFEAAWRSDIRRNLRQLTGLWEASGRP